MEEIAFYITTGDRAVMARWQAAFKKEGWETYSCAYSDAPCPGGGRAEFDLVEVGTPLCRTPEDLRKAIKKRGGVATIAFAAPESVSNSQIAMFLECGADDFVLKSLDERILVAKLKAHMRRLAPAIATAISRLASSSGDIEIDRGRHAVKIEAKRGKYKELSNLTQKELDILTILVGNEKQVISRECILEKLWGDGAAEVYSECIDKHIESIRRKLGLYGKRIRTVYGSGYMFTGRGKA